MNSICLDDFAIIIPSLNEALTVKKVVLDVVIYGKPIVVDDGSWDGTGEAAKAAGAIVVTHKTNQGYDKSLESGLLKALNIGCKYAITIDGDGQHNPCGIALFKSELISGADLVVGDRTEFQRFSERIFSFVSKILWGISDPLCGMKGYKLEHLSKIGYFDSYGSIGTEFAIRCARSSMTIINIKIETSPRSGASRFGRGFLANYKILRSLIIGIFKAKPVIAS